MRSLGGSLNPSCMTQGVLKEHPDRVWELGQVVSLRLQPLQAVESDSTLWRINIADD